MAQSKLCQSCSRSKDCSSKHHLSQLSQQRRSFCFGDRSIDHDTQDQ